MLYSTLLTDRLSVEMNDGRVLKFEEEICADKMSGRCFIYNSDRTNLGEYYVLDGEIICEVTKEKPRHQAQLNEMFNKIGR